MDFYSKDVYEEVITLRQGENFLNHCGIVLTELDEKGGTGEMEITPHHLNPNKGVHGGAFYSLADSVSGGAAIAWGIQNLEKTSKEISCTTVTGSLNFLRTAKGTKLICRADYRKMGRTLAVVDVSIRDDLGNETCSGSFTFLFVDRTRFTK